MHPLANGRSGCGTYCGWVQELGDNILEETGEGRTAQLEASGHREDLSPDAVLEELDQHYAVREDLSTPYVKPTPPNGLQVLI